MKQFTATIFCCYNSVRWLGRITRHFLDNRRILLAAILCVIACVLPAEALPNPFPPGSITVLPARPNVPRIIVRENHAVPVVAMAVVIRGGASSELGVGGVAHYFEHVSLQGSRMYPKPQSAQLALECVGGVSNAVTSRDAVRFIGEAPSAQVETLVQVFADITRHPLLTEDACDRERGIIADELERERDNPVAVMINTAYALSCTHHPYRHAPKGSPADIARIDAKALTAFHRRWCIPQHLSVVLVGDVTPTQAAALVEKAFVYRDASQQNSPPANTDQSQATGGVSRHIPSPINDTMLMLTFAAPSGHNLVEFLATKVLFAALLEGKEAILPAQWARNGISVKQFGLEYVASSGPGRAFLWARLSPDQVSDFTRSTRATLASLRNHANLAAVVEDTKQRLAINFLLQNETLTDQVDTLSRYEVLGGAHSLEQYLPLLGGITLQRVQSHIPTDILIDVTLGQYPRG